MNPSDTQSCGDTSTAGPSAHAPESVIPAAAVPGTPSPVPDAEWERYYAELSEWYRAHGHLRVPVRPLATRKLAVWMETQRERDRQRTLLRVEHERLSALGFDWTPRDAQWEHWLDRLRAFHREHGHVEVPDDFPQDPELGQWAGQTRKQHREGLLTPQQVRTLDSLGFRWGAVERSNDARWEARYAQLLQFRERFGHCNVPAKWAEDRLFAKWMHHQRTFKKKGILSAARIERLEAIGFQWQSGDWRGQDREAHLAKMLAALEAFRAQHGHTEVPAKYPPNRRLGKWVHVQRAAYNDGMMSPERKARLDEVGFTWKDTRRSEAARWEARYAQLAAFRERFGHCWVTASWDEDSAFGHWVDNQRLWKRLGKLSPERIARLEALGIEWAFRRRVDSSTWSDWDEMAAHLRAFHAAHGHTEVPPSHREPPGLGKWVQRQRLAVLRGELRAERRAQLEAIGFALHGTRRGDIERWERRFAQLVAFRERFGHCRVNKQWREDSAFGHWVDNQRLWKRLGKLSPERIARLEGLGIQW